MRIFYSATIALSFATPEPVLAQECVVCDTEVIITASLAECFLDRAAAALAEMQSRDLPVQLVSLGTCKGVERDRRGANIEADSSRQIATWPDAPEVVEEPNQKPTMTFIVDRASLVCLEGLVRKSMAMPAASAWAFRPAEMCGG